MSNLDWEMYQAMLIGKIGGVAKIALHSKRCYEEALREILRYVKEFDTQLDKKVSESEAKLNG